MNINKHKYIVVEGPIGAGKTTLARKINEAYGGAMLLEQGGENPFLERFYKNPDTLALQTQLFFLLQRVKQLKTLRQGDIFTPITVADFMLDKDPLFARLTLDDDELFLYEQVFERLSVEVPSPDLIIYLQAPTEVLMQRIRKRGVLFESNMKRDYLEQLVESYARYFLSYQHSPLLMVNAENSNFLDNADHLKLLLDKISKISSGRHYFNPVL